MIFRKEREAIASTALSAEAAIEQAMTWLMVTALMAAGIFFMVAFSAIGAR